MALGGGDQGRRHDEAEDRKRKGEDPGKVFAQHHRRSGGVGQEGKELNLRSRQRALMIRTKKTPTIWTSQDRNCHRPLSQCDIRERQGGAPCRSSSGFSTT